MHKTRMQPIGPAGPTAEQIKQARREAPINWWTCRFCGEGRVLVGANVTIEASQATAHEATCPERRSRN